MKNIEKQIIRHSFRFFGLLTIHKLLGLSSKQRCRLFNHAGFLKSLRIYLNQHFLIPFVRTGLGRANIAFVVDATNAEMMMFLQRYVYNIARLFQSQGSYISIIAYGKKPHLVTKWQTFTSAQALQVRNLSVYWWRTAVLCPKQALAVLRYSIVSSFRARQVFIQKSGQ